MRRINNTTGPVGKDKSYCEIGSTIKARKSTRADPMFTRVPRLRDLAETTRLAKANLCSLKPSFEAYETKPTTSGIRRGGRGKQSTTRFNLQSVASFLRYLARSDGDTIVSLRHGQTSLRRKIQYDPELGPLNTTTSLVSMARVPGRGS